VRQPASTPRELSVDEKSRPTGSPVFPQKQSRSPWLIMDDVAAPQTQPTRASHGEPIKLSILMAAYNEESTIAQAICEVLDADCPCEMELIVVDDGSTDATTILLSRISDPRVKILRHTTNQGKGAALLDAASTATGTHILPFDADLEYEAEDIARVLEPILKGRSEVVYGVRLFGCNTVYRTYLYAVGNRLLTRLANILFNAHLTDLHTCLKLIPLPMLKSLSLREKGFGLDSEITASLLRLGVRPFEVPVSYYGRSHSEGKKITWRDAVACMLILFRVRMWMPPARESTDRSFREEKKAPVALIESNSRHGAHLTYSPTDGDEFITAVTG
jgi:Glycosyl transferase family 2